MFRDVELDITLEGLIGCYKKLLDLLNTHFVVVFSGDNWVIVCNGQHWFRSEKVRIKNVVTGQ